MSTDREPITDLEGRDLIQALHPIYEASPEHTAAASDEHGELARYLVHVTLPERAHKALVYPGDVDRLVQNLRYGMATMPQMLNQVADRLSAISREEYFATDDGPNAGITAEQRATEAISDLRALADLMGQVTDSFSRVGKNTSHLKIDRPYDPDSES